MRKAVIIISTLILSLLVMGCSSSDAWSENIYYGDNLYIDGTQISPDSYGEIYSTGSDTVAVAVPGTYYLVDVVTANDIVHDFAGNGNGRLTYTGDRERVFVIAAAFSSSSDTVNALTSWKIYVSGASHDSSQIDRFIATPGDVGAMAITNIFHLDTNEYIELYVTADKACNLTVTQMVITVSSLN